MSRARDTAGIIQYNHLTIDDANDRIGIGISAPSEKLSVLGVGQFVNTNTVYINANYGNEGVAFQNASNVPTIFTTGNNEKMRITSAGLVGIGITNPSYKLEVSGNVRINNGFTDALDMSNGNITSVNYLSFSDPGPGEGIKWGGGNGWQIYESPNDLTTNSAGNLQFVDSGSRIFTLDTSGNAEITGNLGVGTDNPAVKLHVYGGALRIAGNDSEGGEINFTDNDGTTVNAHIDVDANGAFRMFTTDANKSLIIGQLVNSGGNITFHTSATERFRIDSRGSFQFSNGFMNETVNINTTARTGTQTVNLDDGMVHYFSTNSTATWKPNFTMSTGNDINATIATGDVFSPTMIVAKGATTHYATAIQVDGIDITPEWLGGAPTDGGGSGTFDVYSYSIIKTGNDTFKAFASVSTYE